MPSYNDALHRSLERLYDVSAGFSVSIDLLQKLAKHLSLDTFVDTDFHPVGPDVDGTKRLSIAGSVLLLEIDFVDDFKVSKVTLSSGTQPHTESSCPESVLDVSRALSSEPSNNDSATVMRISFEKLKNSSSLKMAHSSGGTVAESILFSCLSSKVLGTFPANLRYLADIDRLSPPESDLIGYLDHIASYLAAVHHVECQLRPSDWQISSGFSSRFGKVVLNDEHSQRLGIALYFWHDFQKVNKELELNSLPLSGKAYAGYFTLEETRTARADYLVSSSSTSWSLLDSNGVFKDYLFDTDLPKHSGYSAESSTENKWVLVFNLDHPVYIPQNLLEYMGISNAITSKDNTLEHLMEDLRDTGELKFKVGGEDRIIDFVLEDNSPQVLVESIPIHSLGSLSKIIPVLRNQILLTSLIERVANAPGIEYQNPRVELSAEVSKKIKDSLQLANEVPDDELLGLNTMSNDYMNVQMMDGDPNLGEFIKEENIEPTDTVGEKLKMEGETSEDGSSTKLQMAIILEEIRYNSRNTDYVIKVMAQINGGVQQSIDAQLCIENGIIRTEDPQAADGDISMDFETNLTHQFTQALAMGEDILMALEAIGL